MSSRFGLRSSESAMDPLPAGMHTCPTRADGKPVLFAHTITPATCSERQDAGYHKCHDCVHARLATFTLIPHLPAPRRLARPEVEPSAVQKPRPPAASGR